MTIGARLRNLLRKSSRVHARDQRVTRISDVVSLIDRFIDNRLEYPLEWDDFISWTHSNPSIEATRRRIAEAEPLYFASDHSKRTKAIEMLLTERNRVAVRAGLPQREKT
jgi:hypothetical protein